MYKLYIMQTHSCKRELFYFIHRSNCEYRLNDQPINFLANIRFDN